MWCFRSETKLHVHPQIHLHTIYAWHRDALKPDTSNHFHSVRKHDSVTESNEFVTSEQNFSKSNLMKKVFTSTCIKLARRKNWSEHKLCWPIDSLMWIGHERCNVLGVTYTLARFMILCQTKPLSGYMQRSFWQCGCSNSYTDVFTSNKRFQNLCILYTLP